MFTLTIMSITDKIDHQYSIFIILVFQQNRQTIPGITDNEIFINITKQLEEAKSSLAEKVSYPVIDCHYPPYPCFLNPSCYVFVDRAKFLIGNHHSLVLSVEHFSDAVCAVNAVSCN